MSTRHTSSRSDSLAFLVQAAGSQRRLAEILDVSEENVSRWGTGARNMPPYLDVVAELLERLPPKDWPDRWRYRY